MLTLCSLAGVEILSAMVIPGDRVNLGGARLFIPRGSTAHGGQIDLTLHLHGAGEVVMTNFVAAKLSGVLVNVTLPGLSSVYREKFRDTNAFFNLLVQTRNALNARGIMATNFGKVTVTAFSAGFGGVREMLKDERTFQRIDLLLMADSIYCGYEKAGDDQAVSPELMAGFLRFAGEAAAGRKRMLITHSAQRPPGYASTTETADYLIRKLNGSRTMVEENWKGGLQLRSRFIEGRLEILGFAGETAGAHMLHLRQIGDFLSRLR